MKITYLLLYLTLFVLPFQSYLLEFEVSVITFNVFSLGILVLFCLSVMMIVFLGKKYHLSMVDVFMALFAMTFLVSTILAEDSFRASHMAYKAIFIPFVTYFVLKFLINTEDEFNKILWVLLAGIVTMAFLSVVQNQGLGKRLYAFGLDPLGIATYVVVPMVTVMVMGWWKNKYGFFALFFSLLAFMLTFGRVYFIAILFSPLIYWIIKRGHILKIFTLLFPVCVVLIIGLAFNRGMLRHEYVNTKKLKTIERITNIQLYKRSLYLRGRQYDEGLTGFYKNPVLGTGMKRGRVNVTTHNFHTEWLEYGGVIGYAMGTGIFFWFFLLQKTLAMRDKMTAALLSLLVIILLNCFTNGIMHGVNPAMVFLLMGLAEARRKILEPLPEVQEVAEISLAADATG